MADKELRFTVTQKGAEKAAKEIAELGEEVEQLEGEKVVVDVTAKMDKILGDLDQVAAKAKETAAAADALGQALGPELTAKADVVGIVQDLEKLGLTTDEITANADQLGAKLKELADADVGGKMGASLGTARGKIDELGASASSSKSVLANMIGNTTQDLGALGGIAGSAGVAIGQMGEYMADAAGSGEKFGSVVKNFAAVAGPAAALAAVVAVVGAVMGDQAAEAAAAARRTEEFGDAMEGAANDTLALSKALKGNEKDMRDFAATSNDALGGFGIAVDRVGERIPVIGGFFERTSVDIVKAMDKAGISIYDFAAAVEDGGDKSKAWKAQLDAARAAGLLSEEQYNALGEAANKYAKDQDKAAQSLRLSNVDQAEANAMLDELLAKQSPLSRFTDTWQTLFNDMADGAINTEAAADAVNTLAENLGLTREEVIALGQEHLDERMEAAAEATEEFAEANENLQKWVRDTVDALQEQADQLAEQAGSYTTTADAQIAYNDSVAEFAKVNADATSSLEDVRDAAINTSKDHQTLYESMMRTAGATATATGKVDAQNSSLLETAATARGPAKQAITDYILTLNGIKPEYRSDIIAAIEANDLETAKRLLDEASAPREAAMIADANNAALAQTNAELDAAAHDRYVNFNAQAVGLSALTGAFQGAIRAAGGTVNNTFNVTVPRIPSARELARSNAQWTRVNGRR